MAGYQNIASTRSKLSRPVRNVLYKLALYIIHSRLPEDKKKELPLPHNDKDLSSMKDLRLKSLFEEWTNPNSIPLVINIYYSPFEDRTRTLLEKWKICLKRQDADDLRAIPSQEQILASLRTLIRSVCSCSKILPTYRFLINNTDLGKATYSIDINSPEEFENDIAFNRSSCEIREFEFKDINVIFGHTFVKVCYREDCSSLIPKKPMGDMNIINDYIQPTNKDDTFSSSTSSEADDGDIIPSIRSDNIDIPGKKRSDNIDIVSPISSSPSRHSPFLSIGQKAFKLSPGSKPMHPISPPTPRSNLKDMFLGDSLLKSTSNSSTTDQFSKSTELKSTFLGETSSFFGGKPLSVSPFREKSVLQDSSIVMELSSSNSFSETSFLFNEGTDSQEALAQSELFTNSLTDELGEFIQFCISTRREVAARPISNVSSTLKSTLDRNLKT